MSETSEEKVFEPSDLKLDRLREDEGLFPTAPDFIGAITFFFGIGFLNLFGEDLIGRLQAHQRQVLDLVPEDFATASLAGAGGVFEAAGLFLTGFLVALIGIVFVISLVVNKGVVISFKRISPEFGRLNPAEGLKNIFSLESIANFLKGSVRGTLIAIFGVMVFISIFDAAFWSPACSERCGLQVLSTAVTWLIGASAVVLLALGAADIRLSQALFKHRHRMTHSEMKQENREQFGSPEVRTERNRIRDENR